MQKTSTALHRRAEPSSVEPDSPSLDSVLGRLKKDVRMQIIFREGTNPEVLRLLIDMAGRSLIRFDDVSLRYITSVLSNKDGTGRLERSISFAVLQDFTFGNKQNFRRLTDTLEDCRVL